MLKKFKQKIHTYIFTCCVCTKSFYEKPTCHLAYVKKINFDAKKKTLYHICFVFLHRPRAMSFFCKTFTNAYGLWTCTCEILCECTRVITDIPVMLMIIHRRGVSVMSEVFPNHRVIHLRVRWCVRWFFWYIRNYRSIDKREMEKFHSDPKAVRGIRKELFI
jgi:hypothetical protein